MLEQNARVLLKSNKEITAKGSLATKKSTDESNESFIKELLDRKVDTNEYAHPYPEYKKEAKEMINKMQTDMR